MKKRARIILVIGVGLGAGLLAALPVRAGGPVPGAHKRMPDLTVKVKLIVAKEPPDSTGVTCYSLIPDYTVTNRGNAAAGHFRVMEEWRGSSWKSRGWLMWNFIELKSLGPHKSYHFSYPRHEWPVAAHYWCSDRPDKLGVRITVDNKNEVAESNEGNNRAFAWFDGPYYAHPGVLGHTVGGSPAASHVKPRGRK